MPCDAVVPPRLDEADAVADELYKDGRDGDKSHLQAAVAERRVYEDQQYVKQQGKQRQSLGERS